MKKTFIALSLLLAAMGCHGLSAHEETCLSQFLKELQVKASLGFESETVHRGSKIGQRSVKPSLDVSYSYCDFTPYAGGYMIINADDGRLDNVTQMNPYLGVAWHVTDMFTLDGGFMYYWYMHVKRSDPFPFINRGTNRQREFYIGLTAHVLLNPAFYVYYNSDLKQWVFEPSIAERFSLDSWGLCNFSLDITAYGGLLTANKFNGKGTPKHKNSYWYIGAALDLNYHFCDWAFIGGGPRVAANNDGYTSPPTTSSYTANALGEHNKMLWWGVALTVLY